MKIKIAALLLCFFLFGCVAEQEIHRLRQPLNPPPPALIAAGDSR